jgi:hypothetical protein
VTSMAGFEPRREVGRYEIALVCENGHLLTALLETSGKGADPFCPKCGARTLSACPACAARIRGHYNVPYVLSLKSNYRQAGYCYSCAAPMPFTEKALQAAASLAADLEALSVEVRDIRVNALPDQFAETPMTPVATNRFKRIVVKTGAGAADTFHDLLVDMLSDAAKKTI